LAALERARILGFVTLRTAPPRPSPYEGRRNSKESACREGSRTHD
jgi:hypothetical protein